MNAPFRLPPARLLYLNDDLSLNHAAIGQAAEAWARARHITAGRPRVYSVGRKLWPMRARTLASLFAEAQVRLTDIAEGMRASELHFREHGRPMSASEQYRSEIL